MPRRKVGKPSEEFDKVTGINYSNTKRGYMVLRALDHKLRKKMIKIIHKNKRITVEELYAKLGIAQAVASQQLRILRLSKIVNTKQQGHYVYYSISYSRMNKLNKLVTKFMDKNSTR